MNQSPKSIGTGAPLAGRVLTKIMRPTAPPRGFAAISKRRAREIQSAGGSSHSKAHMRRLANASVEARRK
jgi:hypothetical protein